MYNKTMCRLWHEYRNRIISVLAILFCLGGSFFVQNKYFSNRSNDRTTVSDASIGIFAMDTYMTITVEGDSESAREALEAATDEIHRLDELLSTGNIQSEISWLNSHHGGEIGDDTQYLIDKSLDIYEMSKGAFDITIFPLMHTWGFDSDNKHVPKAKDIESALTNVGADKLILTKQDGQTVLEMPKGCEIDLGGIAKGYTADRVRDILVENGCNNAMINLGGNVLPIGNRADGETWEVVIRKPEDENSYLCKLKVKDKSVVTSGGYQRFFEEDGEIYHHIIDPSTGYPASSGILSVTVISEDGALADGLSTALFVLGEAEACELWKEHSGEFDMVIYTSDKRLIVSENLADSIVDSIHYDLLHTTN